MTQCQTVNTVDETEKNFVTYLAWSDSVKLQKPHQLQLFQFWKSKNMCHENESQNCDK